MSIEGLPTAASGEAKLKWQFGFETDIGGGRENQDDCFVYHNHALGIFIAIVLDGHGREVGKIAAMAARARLEKFVVDTIGQISLDPCGWLVQAHEEAHYHIKATFRAELETQGNEVQETEQGYLLKRRGGAQAWSCVHGGSSCTIVLIIGTKMYIANVGDSSAILCTRSPVLSKSMIARVRDAGRPAHPIDPAASASAPGAMDLTDTLMIIAEHSPESPEEFLRLREFRHREGDPTQPALLVVYDTPSVERSKCNPVFEFDSTGYPVPTNRGRYYKNVRKEWASLVSTPGTARFQDALAFTRSLGDLHLHTYGVTHLPEVQTIDLQPILDRVYQVPGDAPLPMMSLVVCTDGVWDNWTYEDVANLFWIHLA